MDRACTAVEFKRGQGASCGITKAATAICGRLLMVGAMAVIRYAQRNSARRPWLVQLMGRRPTKVAAIALANKTARTVWALMSSGERYRDPQAMQATVSTTG
jgi:transposase